MDTKVQTQKGKVKISMVPEELATPSGLDLAQVDAITQAVNGLVADTFALYLKTKNFHWHLVGVHFRDLHLLFDEHAAALFASIDLLAERVRRIGGTTLRSIGHVARLTTIADDDEDLVTAPNMVTRLLEDNRRLVTSLRRAHEICAEGQDFATSSLLENLIDETERRIWFLFEVSQDLRHT